MRKCLNDDQIDYLFKNLQEIFTDKWDQYAAQKPSEFSIRDEWGVGALGMSGVDVKNALKACNDLKSTNVFSGGVPTPQEFKLLGTSETAEELKTRIRTWHKEISKCDPDCLPSPSEKKPQPKQEKTMMPVNMSASSYHQVVNEVKVPNVSPDKSSASALIAKENLTKIREIIDNAQRKKRENSC